MATAMAKNMAAKRETIGDTHCGFIFGYGPLGLLLISLADLHMSNSKAKLLLSGKSRKAGKECRTTSISGTQVHIQSRRPH
jgi:hypothetical protein